MFFFHFVFQLVPRFAPCFAPPVWGRAPKRRSVAFKAWQRHVPAFRKNLFLLAITALNYVLCHFLVLTGAWIHRKDNPHVERPYRAPDFMIVVGLVFAFANMFFIGAGANAWGNVLAIGLIVALIAIPLYLFRHYVTDKGIFPDSTYSDLVPAGHSEPEAIKPSAVPWVMLAVGIACLAFGYILFYVILQVG